MRNRLKEILLNNSLPAFVAGVTALAIVLLFFLFKNELHETAIFTRVEQTVRYIWVALLGIGGISCLIGIFAKDERRTLIGAGFSLLGSAYMIDAIAILSGGKGILTGSLLAAAGVRLWIQAAGFYFTPISVSSQARKVLDDYYEENVKPTE